MGRLTLTQVSEAEGMTHRRNQLADPVYAASVVISLACVAGTAACYWIANLIASL